MAWNWQQPDWPRFSWDATRLAKAEERFLLSAGDFIGIVRHLAEEDRGRLTVAALSEEAVTTSRIEGEILDRESVQSSILHQLGFAADRRNVKTAEQGIGELMVDLFRNFAEPLTERALFAWHRMVTRGRTDLRDIGTYRTHANPMQVVSGRVDRPRIHFEAPPSNQVPAEMTEYLAWFNRTAGGAESLPTLTRAGIAHLYFEGASDNRVGG